MIEALGRTTLSVIKQTREVTVLLGQTLYWIFAGPFRKKPISRKNLFVQTIFSGIDSIVIVFFVDFFIGMVLAMQSAYQLEQLGAAITAELATMKVTEQIEALETISLNPVRYLVAPRFLALLVMLPCLVILGNIIGMFGGYIVGVTQLQLGSGLYIDTTLEFLTKKDIMTGLLKTCVFA